MFLILQVPPTPTPIPVGGDAPFSIPDQILWPVAPDVVGVWNQANQSGFFVIIQFFVVGILIILCVGILYRAIRQMSRG